ncbi:hypothetical protein AB0G60_05760 [Streptomyces angustmyceticus]|uniref:Lipoprotein n=1 Tax=Streptomyces angustmyceticus TaxID=285578 RepID=A0A5J4L8K8_9ACTN|nr:hypothetical protein [Streptomyces angustmyceticus]UAL66245.1 hypothetical protein K7396_06590 [Streptomyces angustmyceticus]GES28994.1 hypothetical protein San01_14810 [Streptomyces angustmyceticus]
MAVSWRRIAVPAAAVGVLVPAALGAHALLSGPDAPRTSSAGIPATGPTAPGAVPDDARASGPEGTAAVARPSDAPTRSGNSVSVQLSSYDAQRKQAELKPSAGKTVRTGDVIAAAPNRHAPSGALFKVGKVTGSRDGKVRVTTAPATLSELLGDQKVDQRAALQPGEISVRPLSSGVTVQKPGAGSATESGAPATPSGSPGATASGSPSPSASGSSGVRTQLVPSGTRPAPSSSGSALSPDARKALTTLRLGVKVPLPKGIEATGKSPARLSGEVTFRPELIFQYEKRGGLNLLPQRAAIGLGGSYAYGWQVHGKVRGTADTGQVAVPLAAVTGRHVFWVGPVPVVVSTEVTFTYRFTAGGRIVLDADQRTSGAFAVGAKYDRQGGWQPLHEARQQTRGAAPRVEGAASATARVGAHAQVFLYDTAGVGGDLSVHLTGRAAAASGGGAPAWALSAGYDLKTELMLQLKIFGIQIADLRTTPFALHDERKLFGRGKLPAA